MNSDKDRKQVLPHRIGGEAVMQQADEQTDETKSSYPNEGNTKHKNAKPKKGRRRVYYSESETDEEQQGDVTKETDTNPSKQDIAKNDAIDNTKPGATGTVTDANLGSTGPIKIGALPITKDSNPDAGTSLVGDGVVQNAKLVKSINDTVLDEQARRFAEYDSHEIIFTNLEKGKYPITGEVMTVIDGKIPTLFQFVSYHDEELMDTRTGHQTIGTGPIMPGKSPEYITESIKLVRDGTLSVRIVMNPKNYPMDINRETTLNFYEQVIVVGSQYNYEASVREYSRRLNMFFNLCRSTNMIVQNVEKLKMGDMNSNNPIYERRNLWGGDNSHPYLGLIYHPIQWFADEITRLYREAPIETGEFDSISEGELKVEAMIGCITDQFTAAALRRGKQRVDQNLLTPAVYVTMVQACGHPAADVRQLEQKPPLWMKYYNPPRNAWDTMKLRMLLDVGFRNDAILQFVNALVKTGTFDIGSTAGFFSALATASQEDYSVITAVFPSVGIVTPQSFARLLVMEQFAWAYNITFQSGVGIDFNNVIVELLSMLITHAVFPKLVQSGAASFGYRLMNILSILDSTNFNTLLAKHGAVILLQANGEFRRIDDTMKPITHAEAHAGQIFSIFNPAVQHDDELPNYFREICRLLTTPLAPKILAAKRKARYPYTRDDYLAYSSWGVDFSKLTQQVANVMSGRIKAIVDVVRLIVRQIQAPLSQDRSMVPAKRGLFITILNHVEAISRTCCSLFFSMENISNTLQNSYLFCHEGYESRHTMLRPQWLTLGPHFGSQNAPASVSPRQEITVDCRIGLGILVTVSGGVQRPIITTRPLAADYTYGEANKKRLVLPLNAEELAQRGLVLAADSARFAEAMEILQFMSSRLLNTDPIFGFAAQFRDYLQMRTFSEIIDTLAEVYAVNIRGVLGNILIGSNIGDYRTESLMLAVVNRDLNSAQAVNGTTFGRRIDWADPLAKENISMVAALTLSDNSPGIRSSTGIIIQNQDSAVITPGMMLTQPKQVIVYNTNIMRMVNDDRARGIAFFLPDGEMVISPKDERLSGIRLRVSGFGDFAPEHIDFIATSIMYGRLSIEAVDHQFSYDIEYILDNTKLIYERGAAEEMVRAMLAAKNGQYLKIMFPDTTYSIKRRRFQSTVLSQTGYFFPIQDIRTNEVINGIYDLSHKPAEFQINDGDQFGIGPEGLYTPISMLPKSAAEVNMNNFIPVYTSAVKFSGVPLVTLTPPGFV